MKQFEIKVSLPADIWIIAKRYAATERNGHKKDMTFRPPHGAGQKKKFFHSTVMQQPKAAYSVHLNGYKYR